MRLIKVLMIVAAIIYIVAFLLLWLTVSKVIRLPLQIALFIPVLMGLALLLAELLASGIQTRQPLYEEGRLIKALKGCLLGGLAPILLVHGFGFDWSIFIVLSLCSLAAWAVRMFRIVTLQEPENKQE
jgi:hypothetical protein